VLHAQPAGMNATREPLQFGAEIYGHAGLEADLEIQDLALDCLRKAGMTGLVLDLGDARIVRALLEGSEPSDAQRDRIDAALSIKDATALADATRGLTAVVAQSLQGLLALYGGVEVIAAARRMLPTHPQIVAALDDLQALATHSARAHGDVRVGIDLADAGGNDYYSGARFAVYAAKWPDAIARGGRYDEVGAVFGRNRPAVGFGCDLKTIVALVPDARPHAAIRAPWGEDAALRMAVRRLREQGETVVCVLPGHEHEGQEFACDRELVAGSGDWTVRPLRA